MTTRIILLSFLAVFCFAGAGSIHLSRALAADNDVGQLGAAAAPEQDTGRSGPFGEKRRHMKEELMKLPPEERKARIEQLKQQMSSEKTEKLQHRKEEFQSKWDKASPEDRAKFCANVKQKCAEGGRKFACEIAESKCAAGQ